VSFEGLALRCGVPLTAMKGATSYFQGAWVVSDCLREFQPRLMLDDMKDLIDRKAQGAEGDGIFGLCHRWGSVLLRS